MDDKWYLQHTTFRINDIAGLLFSSPLGALAERLGGREAAYQTRRS